MRTPLDDFHQAILNLLEAKRRAEAKPTVVRRRRAAKGYVGERVIWWPPKNHPYAEHPLYKSAGTIVSLGSEAAMRFDSGGVGAVQLMHLDAEPLLEEEVDAALASIRATLEGRS